MEEGFEEIGMELIDETAEVEDDDERRGWFSLSPECMTMKKLNFGLQLCPRLRGYDRLS